MIAFVIPFGFIWWKQNYPEGFIIGVWWWKVYPAFGKLAVATPWNNLRVALDIRISMFWPSHYNTEREGYCGCKQPDIYKIIRIIITNQMEN